MAQKNDNTMDIIVVTKQSDVNNVKSILNSTTTDNNSSSNNKSMNDDEDDDTLLSSSNDCDSSEDSKKKLNNNYNNNLNERNIDDNLKLLNNISDKGLPSCSDKNSSKLFISDDQLVLSKNVIVSNSDKNTAQRPGVLQTSSELHNFINNSSKSPSPPQPLIVNDNNDDETKSHDEIIIINNESNDNERQKHYYNKNIINGSRELTPRTSPLKLNNEKVINNGLMTNLNCNYLDLQLNRDESKETDLLLGKNSVKPELFNRSHPNSKKTSPDDEKPVHHVQFNNHEKEPSKCVTATTATTTTIKEPFINRSSSVSSSSTSSSSSSSSSDDESFAVSEARPPDGGWGWVVVAASFVVNLIADGITFSFGVIFVEFLNYFGENRGKTAWIGSLFMAMPLLSGPIASFLTDRYGCRKVTIVGSVLACMGFVISSVASSMEVLFLTFGVLAGFGLSLCYVASVVIVAYYFDKKRSFATGLSVCGSGIGTFIFAPLTQKLLDEYGWRGTTLILAGLFLNLAVCGALMRDLPWTSSKQKSLAKDRKRNRSLKRKKNGSSAETFSVSNSTNTASVLQPIPEVNEKDNDIDVVNSDRLCSSLVNLPTYVHNGEKVPIEVIELLSTHKNVYNVLMQNYPNLLTPSRSFSDSGRLNEAHINKFVATPSPLTTEPPLHTSDNHANTDAAYVWWLKRNEITPPRIHPNKKLPTAYLKDLRVHRLSLTYRGAMLNIHRYRLRASSCPDIYRNSMTTIAKEKIVWYSGLWDFWDLLIDMFDLSHFTDMKFLLFAISNFLLYTWYDVPYVYLADNAREIGYSEKDSSMLIGIIGIVNMFGEIILGWAGDRPWINAGLVYAVCMGLCGAVTVLVPLLTNYWALCTVSGLFGLFIAANYSLTSIILVQLITLERFTNAYGLLLLVQGLANLIGPPLGGWLYDVTGTYDLSFYLAGIFIALSGLLLIILPATKRYRKFQTLQRQVSSECSIRGETSPKEPKIHSILASCITGKVKQEKNEENHV